MTAIEINAWDGEPFRVSLLPRAPYEASYVAVRGLIGFAFESQSGEHAFASDRRTPFYTRPNSLSYVPPGCDVYSRSAEGGEYLLIRAGEWAPKAVRRVNEVIRPDCIRAARAIRKLIVCGEPAETSAWEELIHALLQAVARVSGAGEGDSYMTHWITSRRLRLIDELIDAQIHMPLPVSVLAQHLGLSVGFLIRAFRAGTGQTPHDYIMARRVSRARVLLKERSRSLADIAAATGFSSQSHMTRIFGKQLSVTPGALR